jgi:hypothetical protein
MDLRTAKRLALIVMALFPALWGLLGFLNDATDFTNTVNGSVRPMIAMTDTFNNPWQTWRAMTAPWAAPAGLIVIMSTKESREFSLRSASWPCSPIFAPAPRRSPKARPG